MTDAQAEQIIGLLTEIRDDQRAMVRALQEPLPEPAPAPCTHAPQHRSDDNPGARFWKCKACGFIYDSENVRT
jgi:hypothetical protein